MIDSDVISNRGDVDGRPWGGITAFVGISLLLLVAAAAYVLTGRTYVIELTEGQIQEMLDARFPAEKRYFPALVVTLSEPKVNLVEGADRVAFGVKALVNVGLAGQTKRLGGRGTITAGLRYNPDDYSFYLDEPTIDQLVVQGVPVKYVDRVSDMATELVHARISRTPVYTLDRTDMRQFAASLVLKSFTVRDGKLVITLGT
ncbi:MAG: DUF1439 domain-containing protein [Planctomycetes bacterium]|nr:DUF1439 domain-containing protein [Planctomycetota bacterium]